MDKKTSQNNDFYLTFRLERFEERNVVLQNETTGEIKWPVKLLPDELRVGDSVMLKINTEEHRGNEEHRGDEEEYRLRKRLLEELIN